MGVDPGLVDTGFGVLEADGRGFTVIDAGVVSTVAGQSLEARLNAIHGAVHRLMADRAPGLVVVEDLYTEYKFPRTAVLMGHARGVIYLAARQLGVTVLALSPSEVKRAITGNGAAGKAQMQRGVQTLLGLKELPRPSHVADALGLALTGMARITGRTPTGRALVWRAAAEGEASEHGNSTRSPNPVRRVQPEFGEAQPQASRADFEFGEAQPQASRVDMEIKESPQTPERRTQR
jgi:crossover junction endodeoxyribonuclease RuvC